MSRPRKIYILFCLAVVALLFYLEVKRESDLTERYISDLHLNLKGEITEVMGRNMNGSNLVRVKVISTSINRYLPAKWPYFFRIEGNYAEIYTMTPDCRPGDLIEINSDRLICIINNSDSVTIALNTSDTFKNFIQNYSKFH